MTERPPRQREQAVPSDTSSRAQMRKKVRSHRARLKEKGLRPVQVWLPDVRTASFRAAARKQARAIAASTGEADDIAFVEAISES